ncbi:cellulose synthase-like protein G3 isoform X2 [Olea europaea var. sylvestris]|uniref:cellulose synthase-like protein G3 isoform X2 n=1 Tax=Olea europaea var. sylvestris TaxID=158386 RepID=UPI000C1D7363|nr:cellulose synthase-like protein G3 isoform X2 [Olea europaea var. sylvestris]
MEQGCRKMGTSTRKFPLHSSKRLRRRFLNRAFAVVYFFAIVALLYHHAESLLYSPTYGAFFISTSLLLSDIILGFMWLNSQAFRMNPIIENIFPENIEKVCDRKNFPALDIFICTADPYKEPPMTVANTALSVMAYDYPAEKLSAYVSDDGGSEFTLFALMEAAKFGNYWLPFCRENKVMNRCPEAYFRSNSCSNSEIKTMYESMKRRVESVVEKGKIIDEYKTSEEEAEAFGKWNQGFTRQDHPTVIQVVSQAGNDTDIRGHSIPNLVYVSREKCRTSEHHYKGGALNALLRVSAVMTNAPIILTLDCDMISNDPSTPHQMLCHFLDSSPKFGFVQFPQRFNGLNKADIYASEFRRMFYINPVGMNGLSGPDYFGTGTFFRRRIFYGAPSSFIEPEIVELNPDNFVERSIKNQSILELAHHVAGCNYENQTNWGSKIGFRYGSLVEDYYTGYRLHCEGWKSVYCNPERASFLCEMPISLNDSLNQTKRWALGLLEVSLSKHSPLVFGVRFLGPLKAHCYAYYAFGPLLSFPVAVYACVPQIALLNDFFVFPKVWDPWFFLYIFLFLGAYVQDCLEFVLARGTILRWWSDQRMWLIRSLSSDLFGSLEYITHHLGIATRGFEVTSKVVDNEQNKRYYEGKFEFGVPSPIFVPFSTGAVLNLAALIMGFLKILRGENLDCLIFQMLIASFGVVNCWPIYEAMVLRSDNGRMPIKITFISVSFAWVVYAAVSFILKLQKI